MSGGAARRVQIRVEGIRLGQLLKLTGAVDQGSDVKQLLATATVLVNGMAESRRGRQLRAGDVVQVARTRYLLTSTPAPGGAAPRHPRSG